MARGSSPTVSVVIPVYNGARYLAQAIQSVLDQTYKNFELIIVDDGSTDHTREVVCSFIEKEQLPIRYIFQNNGGEALARNTGIAAAKGDYLAFIDADDMWMPNKLEQEVSLLEESKGIGLVFTSYRACIGEKVTDEVVSVDRQKLDGNLLSFEELLKRSFIAPSAIVVRKEIMQQVGPFDSSFKMCTDYDMWLRISQITNIAYIDEPLMIYRIHPWQISTKDKKLNVEGEIRIYETWLKHLRNKNQKAVEILRECLHIRYYVLGRFYLHTGNGLKARCCFRTALHHRIFGPKSFKLIYRYVLTFM